MAAAAAAAAAATRPSLDTYNTTTMRHALAAAALASAAALDANVYGGSWELVGGSSGTVPTQSFGHATTVPGYLIIQANDTSPTAGPNGDIDIWEYNIITNTWKNPCACAAFAIATPRAQHRGDARISLTEDGDNFPPFRLTRFHPFKHPSTPPL